MSAATRLAISTAASTVDGITCTPNYRQITRAGEACVRLDRHDRSENGFGFVVTWQVMVCLPQSIADAETYLDEKAPLLVAALSEEMIVTSVIPQELVLDNSVTVPVVVIEGSRESDL